MAAAVGVVVLIEEMIEVARSSRRSRLHSCCGIVAGSGSISGIAATVEIVE